MYMREYINVETASDSMSADDASVLSTDPTLGGEAFRLTVLPQRIEIAGGSYGGVFNGVQALFRLLPAEIYAKNCPLPGEIACTKVGQAYLHPLTSVESLNTPMFNVTFEPGCRNSWHSHSGGQLLIATAGIGYYQERGKAARRLYPGAIVEIAPDVEHWHGAAPDRWFAHIAIECNPGANQVTWICPVNDADYLGAAQAATDACQSDNRSLDKRQQAIVAIAAFTEVRQTCSWTAGCR